MLANLRHIAVATAVHGFEESDCNRFKKHGARGHLGNLSQLP